MSSGVLQVFCRCSACWGHAGLARGPGGGRGHGLPVPRLLPIGVSGPCGSRTGRSPAGEAGAAGVLDTAGRGPIIGRRETGGCAVVVAAGPMGSSGAGAPGCGHPCGWPAAWRRGAWGWSARAAGSIRCHGRAAGAGARHGSGHALPAAGPAHLAWCCAPGVSSALTCPSRIA